MIVVCRIEVVFRVMKLILPILHNHDSNINKISNSSGNSGNIDTCKSGKIYSSINVEVHVRE